MSLSRGCVMIRGRQRRAACEPSSPSLRTTPLTPLAPGRRRRVLDPAFPSPSGRGTASPSKPDNGLALSSPGIRSPVRRVRSGAMSRARSRSPVRSFHQQPRSQSCRNLMMDDHRPTAATVPLPRNALKDLLGDETLKNITDIKSEIAGMRPTRRKIRFAESPPDDNWKAGPHHHPMAANAAGSARISNLTVDDLTIRGQARTLHDQVAHDPEEAKQEAANTLEDEIEALEGKIRKAFKTLKRTTKEACRESELVAQLETENKSLRRELLAMPAPHGQCSMRQSLKQFSVTVESLRKKVEEVDEQVTMLEWQRQRTEMEAERLLMQMMSSQQHDAVSEELSVSMISSSETSLPDDRRCEVPLSSLLLRRQSFTSTEEASEIDSFVSTEINEAVKNAFSTPLLVGTGSFLVGRRYDDREDEDEEKSKSKSSSRVKISMAAVELGPCTRSVPAAA